MFMKDSAELQRYRLKGELASERDEHEAEKRRRQEKNTLQMTINK